MNAEIRGFEVSIRNFIEQTAIVPIEAKYLVLRQITGELKAEADKVIVAECEEKEAKKEVKKDAESLQ